MLDPHPFVDRTTDEMLAVLNWITQKLDKKASWNYNHTSEDINRLLARDTGISLSEDEFKYAMYQIGGYKPANAKREHWVYRVSERSYAFAERELA